MSHSYMPEVGAIHLDYLSSPAVLHEQHSLYKPPPYSPPSDDPFVSSTSVDDSQLMNKPVKRKYYRKKTDKVQRWTQHECDLYEQFIDVPLPFFTLGKPGQLPRGQ